MDHADSASSISTVSRHVDVLVMRMGRLALVLLALFAIAPSCSLPAASGRVVDRETRAPIAGVLVVELWREGRALSDVAATRHVRRARTDPEGRFEFPGEASVRATGGASLPSYVLVHTDYGLIRAGERDLTRGPLEFALSRGDPTARQALASLCESPPREEWEREIARELCSQR